MTARNSIYAALIITVMVVLLLLRGFLPIIPASQTNAFLQPNNVLGMEIVFNGLPYTLNFQQQQEMTELINRSIPIGKLRDIPTLFPGLDKVVVYQFGQQPVDMTPVDFDLREFFFRTTAWNVGGYLMDNSAGEMLRLVEAAHDP